MSLEPQDPEIPPSGGIPPEDERLSGTLFGGLQSVTSALGALSTAFAAFGILAIVVGLGLLIFTSELRLYGYILLGAGGALVSASVVISFETVARALTGRRGRYSTNTVIMVTAFIGIAAVVNFIAFENTARMDVTATKKFSLAPRTTDVLKTLSEPVEAKAFFGPALSPGEELLQDQIDSLLHEFDVRSSDFEFEFIDPDINPETARQYGINPTTGYGNIVFEALDSEKRHTVTPSRFLEQGFVTALIIVTGQEQKAVYFLQGHGERDTLDFERETDGFGLANEAVRSENYLVSTLNLRFDQDKERFAQARTADEVNLVVVAGPTSDLPEEEAQILHEYLKDGGNMMFLLDPGTPQTFRDFLAVWGLEVGAGHLLDTQRSLGDNNEVTFLRRGQYFSQIPDQLLSGLLPIFKLTSGLDTVYYPGLTPINASKEVLFFPPLQEEDEEGDGGDDPEEEQAAPTVFATALAFTSPESWLIEDPNRYDRQPGDLQGPFFPAIALRAVAPVGEDPPTDPDDIALASMIVFGDSDFASNGWFYTPDNSDFFLNSVNWLVGDIPLANIRPKVIDQRLLVLTDNEYEFMRFSGWLLMPALMALAGGFVWWRRR